MSFTTSFALAFIVDVAPSSLASASRESSISTAITSPQPATFSAWVTSSPIMPLPTTTDRSPRITFNRSTAWTATDTGSTIAACSNGQPVGSGYTICSGTATNSANAPGCRYSPHETPSTRRLPHKFTSPHRHGSHLPHEIVESNVTRSPAFKRRTADPTSAIVPAASCPITIGGTRRPLEPSYPCTSLPQIPQAATRTSTSVGPSSGRGTSASLNFRYS